MHIKGTSLKNSFLRAADLKAGELSVWRVDAVPGFSEAEAARHLGASPPSDNSLSALYVSRVEAIRAATIKIGGTLFRAYCVLDDCSTDDAGGFHPAHAAISLADCDEISWSTDDNLVSIARELLVQIFSANTAWTAE